MQRVILALLLASATTSLRSDETSSPSRDWRSWRGPLATGLAPHARPAIGWAEGTHVRWKTALPGKGHSTPIVVDQRIFLTTAIPVGEGFAPRPDTAPGAHDNLRVTHSHESRVLCVDRRSGKILWETRVHVGIPHEGGHKSGSLASASCVSDGQRVYASFGSRGVYGLDIDGNLEWKRDLGVLRSKHGHGEGSSPALWKDLLFINQDHEGDSFVIALDTASGETRWRKERPEVSSWASPIVYEHAGVPQLIVSGTRRVRGYAVRSGDVIWECGGLSQNVVATPVAADGICIVGNSYDDTALMAIRLSGAKGDLTGSDHVLWTRKRNTPYVPSPLLYDGCVYFLRHYQNILYKVDARTGRAVCDPIRLSGIGSIYASPVAAAGRIYVTDLRGRTIVLSHEASPDGKQPEVLALNRLDGHVKASLAVTGEDLFIRSETHLYCIAEK